VPSEIVPDVAPEDGVQPDPQLDPPHVRVATFSTLYLPATQLSHAVLTKPGTLHVPVKPLDVPKKSDVKVTLRKPVLDV
jgi:hypothetical protein